MVEVLIGFFSVATLIVLIGLSLSVLGVGKLLGWVFDRLVSMFDRAR